MLSLQLKQNGAVFSKAHIAVRKTVNTILILRVCLAAPGVCVSADVLSIAAAQRGELHYVLPSTDISCPRCYAFDQKYHPCVVNALAPQLGVLFRGTPELLGSGVCLEEVGS